MRDAARQELVRRTARAAALIALAALAAAPGGCGGDSADAGKAAVAWDGTPVVRASSTGARILTGKLRNQSSSELRISAPQVKLLDARGQRIQASVVFANTFVRSIYPHNGITPTRPSDYPEAEQRRVGFLAVVGGGDETPLTVSWRERRGHGAARLVLGSASLELPAAAG